MIEQFPDIVNLNEERVYDAVKKCWPTSQYCKCESCMKDVITLSLNKIQPKYVSTVQGRLFVSMGMIGAEQDVEIFKLVCECMEKVGKAPKHN